MIERLDELLGRPVSMRALAVLRIFVGVVVLVHLQPFLDAARHGTIYRDHFSHPYADWYPHLPRELYVALLWLGAVAAVAMAIGLLTRFATATTFAVVTYNLFLSTTHMHHNRAYLVALLAVLALAPCGRELSFDAWWRRRQGRPPLDPSAPAWPLWLARFEASVVYGASGLSKLLDPDWFGGRVPWGRITWVRRRIEAESPLPSWVVDVLVNRAFHSYAAKVIVLTELFIALGLWRRRTRYAAVWIAVCFHVAIEVGASVQVFSYLGIAALVIWAVPSTADRRLTVDARWHRSIRALDWLDRFELADGPLQVVDRDGSRYRGFAAIVLLLSRLPVTAWLALPLRLLPGARRSLVHGPNGDGRPNHAGLGLADGPSMAESD